ncbi:MAG: AbrB/MazE/SpoVT family DNA-binding domain-containing protein, partial [Betaproteobacteria bacterium]|nr:AbrB/MazE/SpoVT family DNA-binding domain-containing protein [Betaproteobacteria bacterium]
LGLEPGDRVVLVLRQGEIVVFSPSRALARAQEVVRRYVPKGTSLAAELIRERRREAKRDEPETK